MMSSRTSAAKHWLRRPATIVIAALAMRIVLMLATHAHRFENADDFSYHNEATGIAESLAAGHGFSSPFGGSTGPTAWLTPVYPALCAVIFRLLGAWTLSSAVVILVINCVFSAFTCIPILNIGRRVGGEITGQLSAWLWAVVPFFAEWPLTWAWDTALVALCAALLVEQTICLKDSSDDSWRRWTGFGILSGISLLVNPSVLTIIALALVWLKIAGIPWKRLALMVLVCAVTVSPWIARNRIVFGHWVFLRSNFPFEFEISNYHLSFGTCWGGKHPCCNIAQYNAYQQMGEIAYVHKHAVKAPLFLHEHFKEFLVLCGKRFVMTWDGTTFRAFPAKIWMSWLFFPLSLGAGVGFLFLWRDKAPDTTFLFLVSLLFPWPYYITCIQIRFRAPIEPLLLIANVYLLLSFYRLGIQALQRRKPSSS